MPLTVPSRLACRHIPLPIEKTFANEDPDYRHFVSYYRGRDKKRVKDGGEVLELEAEIDFIIEENGILYPIEIKKNTQAKAVICNCPEVGVLRENILQIPVWYL